MHGCLLFLPIPILGDFSTPIPIPNTRYGYTIILILIPNTRYNTNSYRLFIDIILNNRLISPIPIPILGGWFIPLPVYRLISGRWSNSNPNNYKYDCVMIDCLTLSLSVCPSSVIIISILTVLFQCLFIIIYVNFHLQS